MYFYAKSRIMAQGYTEQLGTVAILGQLLSFGTTSEILKRID